MPPASEAIPIADLITFPAISAVRSSTDALIDFRMFDFS